MGNCLGGPAEPAALQEKPSASKAQQEEGSGKALASAKQAPEPTADQSVPPRNRIQRISASGTAMEVPVSADSASSKGGAVSPRSGGLQRQSAGSTGSGRRIDRRSAESGVGGGGPPQERVSLTLQRISVQAPGVTGTDRIDPTATTATRSSPALPSAWLSRSSLDEVESDSKRSEKVVDKLNRHSADGAAERLQRTSVAGSAVSAASSGGDAVAHLPRTSLNKDSSGSAALSRSSAGSAHGVKTFVDKLKKSSVSVLDRLETRAEVGNNDKKKRGESIPTYDVNLYHMG